MKCIIVDDEPKAIDVLKLYIEEIDFLEVVNTLRDGLAVVNYLQHNKIDLLFLDINMPKLNGLETINVLSNPPHVIFTTAYTEFALSGYELNAVDYLLKPIEFDRFLKAVNKVQRLHALENYETDITGKNKKDYVLLKSGKTTHKVLIEDITFIKKDGNYLEIYTFKKRILLRLNMSQVYDILPEQLFVRVHKSYFVALNHIETILFDKLRINGVNIPIGISYRKDLNHRLRSDSS